ncbi:MAG: dihydrodipicolinate synthase family protein [Desulfobacterales bacterium]|nr:dihydrodipicolinate synthase family protein [Desulfobacterales bacterium]MDX2510582.1 dihydrodipicolinate synthase family protein [Desulfobacterales bacterium]
MHNINLHGIFPPIATPFENGKVAFDKLRVNVEKLSKTGVSGIVVLGSNGEYVYLSEKEKRDVIETVVRAVPDNLPVIAGTACESAAETIRLTCDSAELGVRAALLTTPHYYGGKMTDEALFQFYTAVADSVPIPVLLYNVPKFTHLNLTADLVSRLSRHPNIVGIKDSSGNVNLLGQYLNGSESNFKVLVGTAGVLFSGLALGCVGGIVALANVAPEACVKILEFVEQGNFEKARQLQLKVLPVNNAVTVTYGISGLKAAMDMLDYFGGDPRLPMLPAGDHEKTAVREILIQAGLLNRE